MNEAERRYRLCYVNNRTIRDILNGDVTVASFDVPDDARVVHVFEDFQRDAFGVVFESVMFEPVPLGEIPPQLPPLGVRRG